MSKKYTIDEAREKFAQVGLILLEDEYIGNKVKMRAKCPHHPDKELWLKMNDVASGRGCKYCGIERRVNQRRVDFNRVRSAFKNKGYTLLSTKKDYVNAMTKLAYICPNHPNEIQYITYASISDGHGCRKCANELNAEHQKKDFVFIQQYFRDVGYTLLTPAEDYKNSSTKLKYICPKHPDEIQETTWSNFYGRKTRCRYCASQNSKGEQQIAAYLKSNAIEFVRQKRFSDLRNPVTNYQLPYDFWLPRFNLLIEYQGGYHDGKVHERNPRKQTEQDLVRQHYRDNLKRQYAKEHDYQLLEIWYWDFDNIESILAKELSKIA